MDEQDEPRPPWHGPSEPTWAAGTPVGRTPEPDADGPPPPPWVRRRSRRRRNLGIVAVVVLLIAVPFGLGAAGLLDRPAAPTASDEGTEPDGEAPTDGPSPLDAPDPDQFSGSDADLATVLRDVEASERVMLRFQADLAEAFALGGDEDLDPFFAAVRGAAEQGAEALTDVRDDLDEPVSTEAADEIRQVYLDHLDAWLALMEVTADDPSRFGPTGDTGRFDVEINATALDFARTVESRLPDDAADEITRFAQRLLDRGFRFDTEAEV